MPPCSEGAFLGRSVGERVERLRGMRLEADYQYNPDEQRVNSPWCTVGSLRDAQRRALAPLRVAVKALCKNKFHNCDIPPPGLPRWFNGFCTTSNASALHSRKPN